ncbi:MAG: Tex-like N-terminal domain-containing protein, partial [Candidatus Eisenbacteria bacterium]
MAQLAHELAARPQQITAAIALLDGGASVPFIARYR